MSSDLERIFDYSWRVLAPEEKAPRTEFRFHRTRKWRFDRAWSAEKVAVEIDGGTYSGGRHVRGQGYHDQLDKQNEAVAHGWLVLRFDTKHLKNDPIAMVDIILQVLKERRATSGI